MNPAATGNSNNVDVFLLNRQQWIGFENAPRTSILNAHSYFNAIQSGLGLSLMFDKIAASHQTVNAMASYAYHIGLTDEILLSLGLSGGVYNSNWDPSRNRFNEEVDDGSLSDKSSRTAADFDAGLELNVYGVILGASLTHLLNSNPDTGKPGREVYGYVRYRWAVSRNIDIAPGVMYRYANYCNYFDANITGYYLKKYWAGLSFRPNSSCAAMLGGEFGMFRVGYAYDYSIGNIRSLATNTHEFMLSVRIQKPQKGRKTPRFLD
jgi:type IX secretion system PorP/SprF family membrane protein